MSLEKKTLVKGALGISPIPVVGEVGLSMFFYDVLKTSGNKGLEIVAVPAALLTRFELYRSLYIPLYEKFF
jgi:hypothetical protein